MLKRITLAIGLLLAPTAALAQSSVLPYYYNSGGVKVPVGSSNPLPISGSFSASLAPFTPGLSGARATPITVTVADSSGNLPTNTGSVIVYNVGANPMYCNVNGIAATVADQYISSAGGWFNFGVPAGTTTLHCIATGGSTTANAAGGTGLGAGTGGGSGGGGGGGAITAASGSYASGALSSGSVASGAYASGSISSGAVASGAFASGALASGSIAAGAQVDLLTMRGTVAPGTAPANSLLTSCIYNSSPITLTTGQGSAVQCSVNGYPTVVVSNTLTALTPGDGITTGTYASGSPTLGAVLLWNGTTYDRWKSTATGFAGVNPGTPANWGVGATGSAVPANSIYSGVLDASGGTNLLGLAGDPCQTSVKTTLPITLATAAVKVIATGVSAKKIYVCQINLNNNAADTVAIFEATTATTCATSAVAVVGAGTSVASAGTGYNFAATGGISIGNGANQVLQTATNANDLCIAQSAATQLTGSITYVTR